MVSSIPHIDKTINIKAFVFTFIWFQLSLSYKNNVQTDCLTQRVLLLQVNVHLWVIAMKMCSTFSLYQELELHYGTEYTVQPKISLLFWFNPIASNSVSVF